MSPSGWIVAELLCRLLNFSFIAIIRSKCLFIQDFCFMIKYLKKLMTFPSVSSVGQFVFSATKPNYPFAMTQNTQKSSKFSHLSSWNKSILAFFGKLNKWNDKSMIKTVVSHTRKYTWKDWLLLITYFNDDRGRSLIMNDWMKHLIKDLYQLFFKVGKDLEWNTSRKRS